MLRRYYGKISKLPIDQFVGHDGELVVDDVTGKVYVMDGVTYGGTELVGATPRFGLTPPVAPTPGTLWYDPISGRTYIYFQDTWVDAAPNTTYSLPIASQDVLGGVKVDNTTIVIDEYGVISAIGDGYTPDRLINGNKTVSLDANGILNFPNNNGQIGQLEAPYTGLEFRTGSGADWIGLSYGEINDNNTSYFYFDKDGSNYLTANHLAHLQLKNPAHNGHVEWLFDSSGTLKIPGKITTPSVSGDGSVGANLYIGAGPVTGSNATGGSTIIQGGHGDPGTGGSGPVQIQTGSDVENPNFKHTWNFDGQGRLTLPGAYATGGTLMSPSGFSLLNTDTFQFPRLDTASIIVPPNGSNDPIQLINAGSDGIRITTPRGTVLFGNQPEIIITQSHHFHIMKQDPAEVDLFFGDDYNYLKLPKEGNVWLSANGPTWTFNSDGNLTLPSEGNITSSTGNIHVNGNINALSFHATQGTGLGFGYLFTDPITGAYTSGMRHSNSQNTLQLIHESSAGLDMFSNGLVRFGNVRVIGNLTTGFLNVSTKVFANIGDNNGYRFNDADHPTPTAIVHNNSTNQLQLIHENGRVSVNPNASIQTNGGIILNNDLITAAAGILYINGSPIETGGTTNTAPSSTPPGSPINGQLWYDTDSGKIYVYLTDSWVDASPTLIPNISSLVNGDFSVTLDVDGNLNLSAGVDILDSNGNSVLGTNNYGNAKVAAYLPTNSIIIGLRANANIQAIAINTLTANALSQATQINGLRANITAANAAIITANVGMKNYVDNAILTFQNDLLSGLEPLLIQFDANLAAQTANANIQAIAINTLTANALSQDTQIKGLRANITAANTAIISANVGMKSYVDSILVPNSAAQEDKITSLLANANIQAIAINTLTANALSQDTQIKGLRANITAANTAIVTANIAMKSYVESITDVLAANAIYKENKITLITANLATQTSNANVQTIAINTLTANALSQATQINGLRANIISANSSISTLKTQVYSNANVFAFLPTYSGTVGGDISIGGNIAVNGSITVGTLLQAPQYTKAANATGTTGQICWDSNYIYICTATNTWKRVALTGGY